MPFYLFRFVHNCCCCSNTASSPSFKLRIVFANDKVQDRLVEQPGGVRQQQQARRPVGGPKPRQHRTHQGRQQGRVHGQSQFEELRAVRDGVLQQVQGKMCRPQHDGGVAPHGRDRCRQRGHDARQRHSQRDGNQRPHQRVPQLRDAPVGQLQFAVPRRREGRRNKRAENHRPQDKVQQRERSRSVGPHREEAAQQFPRLEGGRMRRHRGRLCSSHGRPTAAAANGFTGRAASAVIATAQQGRTDECRHSNGERIDLHAQRYPGGQADAAAGRTRRWTRRRFCCGHVQEGSWCVPIVILVVGRTSEAVPAAWNGAGRRSKGADGSDAGTHQQHHDRQYQAADDSSHPSPRDDRRILISCSSPHYHLYPSAVFNTRAQSALPPHLSVYYLLVLFGRQQEKDFHFLVCPSSSRQDRERREGALNAPDVRSVTSGTRVQFEF